MKIKENIKDHRWKIFVGILIVLSLFRIWLQYNIPLFYIGDSAYDDDLMMEYAKSIISGNWLGAYTSTTLIKGITFPLFYVLIMLTKVPYAIALSILNIIAIWAFVFSIKKLIKNKYTLGVIYLFLLYSPATMDFLVTQRLYRNSLTFAFVLLVLAGFIGVYLNLDNLKQTIKYAILAGISLFLFWNLREDTIWIMPFCIGASTASIIAVVLQFAKQRKKIELYSLVAIFIPFAILLVRKFSNLYNKL